MSYLVIKLITIYQRTLSPDHSWLKARYPYGFCRFYPTCSEYAKEAFSKHNFFYALILTIKRVTRCNPFTQPQIDKLP